MKGLSPLIAAVLLIAFTVAVGGVISIWLTTFSKTVTSEVESATEYQTKCASTYFVIDRVFQSKNMVVLTNMGTENVTLKTIILSDGSFGTINKYNSMPGIEKGQTISLNLTQDTDEGLDITGKSLEFLTIKGLCLDVVPVEATCRSTQGCWVS